MLVNEHPLRRALHNEVHARPPEPMIAPLVISHVVMLTDADARQASREHLAALLRDHHLPVPDADANHLRVNMGTWRLRWELHTEFVTWTFMADAPMGLPKGEDYNLAVRRLPQAWLKDLPGECLAHIQLWGKLSKDLSDRDELHQEFREDSLVACQLAEGSATLHTDFQIDPNGCSRMLLRVGQLTQRRLGRLVQRLLEIETYRMMALRGLPVAKELGTMLSRSEPQVAAITAQLEGKAASDQELLDALVALAAHVERAMAQHMYRFSATAAYDALVQQRILELRERPIPGTPTLGEFMRRRLSPAIATVAATGERLQSLSERVARASDLLSTRVGIATEAQNQQLLEKLTRGQEVQVRLQSTVEGLSIAAISYYVVSLLLYGAKSLKLLGLNFDPEVAVGVMVPVVLWGVWRITRYVQHKIYPA